NRYMAAISFSGYNDPIGERNSLASQNPTVRAENNPYLLLKKQLTPPRIALYLSGQPHDGYEAAVGLEQAAKAPTTVHVVFIPKTAGGHNMALWRPQVVPAFRWLTLEMGQHRTHSRGTTPLAPSSGGSTHAALASGTTARAGAGQRR